MPITNLMLANKCINLAREYSDINHETKVVRGNTDLYRFLTIISTKFIKKIRNSVKSLF